MNLLKIILVLLASLTATNISASIPSDHAPIGVMADHTHKTGEWMLSHRYKRMEMGGLYVDDSEISVDDVKNSMMTPTKMTAEMNMLSLMYGLNDTQTLMFMATYLEKEMTMRNSMSKALSEMSSTGLGDTKISLLQNLDSLYPFGKKTHINFALSLPTGAIDETNNSGTRLPYKMQLGSGTFDPSIILTNHGDLWLFKYGYQLGATVRLGHNSEGYSQGDEYSATYWGAYNFNNHVSISERVTYTLNTAYDGVDNQIANAGMSSIARDASKQSGEIIKYSLGLNYLFTNGTRLAFEYDFPLYQNLDGAQLGMDKSFILALQKTF
jgi:hypothetical protein